MTVPGSLLSADLGSGRAHPQTVQLQPVSHEVLDQNSLRTRSVMAEVYFGDTVVHAYRNSNVAADSLPAYNSER